MYPPSLTTGAGCSQGVQLSYRDTKLLLLSTVDVSPDYITSISTATGGRLNIATAMQALSLLLRQRGLPALPGIDVVAAESLRHRLLLNPWGKQLLLVSRAKQPQQPPSPEPPMPTPPGGLSAGWAFAPAPAPQPDSLALQGAPAPAMSSATSLTYNAARVPEVLAAALATNEASAAAATAAPAAAPLGAEQQQQLPVIGLVSAPAPPLLPGLHSA